MNVVVQRRMTVTEFLDWAAGQPNGRYELVDGLVIAMSPERNRHALVKLNVATALRSAATQAKLDCTVFPDGATVVIDKHTSREPDAAVQCGPVDLDSLVLDAPVIVVEVLSPSSERSDTGEKLSEYFSVASIRHYLIVNPFRRLVVHHQRKAAGNIETTIVESGEIELSPPGLTVAIAALFESISS
jgi:Uma2 family endonuclease